MNKSISMAADSTQEIYSIQSRKRMKKYHHKRQKVKKLKHRSELTDCDNTNSGLQLDKPLENIESYINDKHEMTIQMFNSLSNKKLASMLPSILRSLDATELKQLCVEQLEVMSEKRIKSVLQGIDPSSISSSDSDIEDEVNFSHTEISSNALTHLNIPSNVTTENKFKDEIIDVDLILAPRHKSIEITCGNGGSEDEIVAINKTKYTPNTIAISSSKVEVKHHNVNRNSAISHSSDVLTTGDPCSSYLDNHENKPNADAPLIPHGKMEILELEMRARAIQSMLNRTKNDLMSFNH